MACTVAIILNWRDAASTVACLDSLAALNGDLGIVVVDNDSGDGSLETIRRHCRSLSGGGYTMIGHEEIAKASPRDRWVSVVSSGRNGGYAFGNNVGIRCALTSSDCRFIWILNADVIVPACKSLTSLVSYMDKYADVGICGATVCYSADPRKVQTLGGGEIDRRGRTTQIGQGQLVSDHDDVVGVEMRLDYVNGACSFVRREFIEDIGVMCEDYFLYFEELDWATRGRGRYRLGYCEDAIVLHHVGSSIGTSDDGSRSLLSVYYLNSSRVRYCMRYQRGALFWVSLSILIDAARAVSRLQWRKAIVTASTLFPNSSSIPNYVGLFRSPGLPWSKG